jgi:hypothetical protein
MREIAMAFVTHVGRTAFNGTPDGDDEFAAMVEPRPGHTDEEVEQWLGRAGAKRVMRIAPGFISAMATPTIFQSIVGIAYVNAKKESQPTAANARMAQ